MRYQLRYIRAQRTRSSPGAKHDDSPPERACTNFLATVQARRDPRPRRARVRSKSLRVLTFDVVRLSAPVPWLSGRASASHAEGRWFDPSRDHISCRSSKAIFQPNALDGAKHMPNIVLWRSVSHPEGQAQLRNGSRRATHRPSPVSAGLGFSQPLSD